MSNMMLFNEPFADLERLFAARQAAAERARTNTSAPQKEHTDATQTRSKEDVGKRASATRPAAEDKHHSEASAPQQKQQPKVRARYELPPSPDELYSICFW